MKFSKILSQLCLLFIFGALISSCKTLRATSSSNKVAENITKIAKQYIGIPYRLGGSNKDGIDCSGLVFIVFKEMGRAIPRVSWQQASYFQAVEKKNIQKGDLVFFITNGGKYINHVGIVSEVSGKNQIRFISALSKGVAEDNLYSNYWSNKLAKVTRARY